MSNYCLICGTELILEDNVMCSDIETTIEFNSKDDSMITYAHCPKCQLDYEFTDASLNELDDNVNFVGTCKVYKEENDDGKQL